MKKTYKVILGILILEYFCLSLMSKLGIYIQSWIGNAIGALLFLMPVLILLYLIEKDENISKNGRLVAKIFLRFFLLCFIAGAIGKAIALNAYLID